MDISREAVKIAKKRAKGICKFHKTDILKASVSGAPFGFVFDIGCFHHHVGPLFAERVANHLEAGGLWFSMIGSADRRSRVSQPGQIPPPGHAAAKIVCAVEERFEIIQIRASNYGSQVTRPVYAPPGGHGFSFWACLMRKRTKEL